MQEKVYLYLKLKNSVQEVPMKKILIPIITMNVIAIVKMQMPLYLVHQMITESDKLSSDNVISDTETEYDNPARKEIQFRRRRIMYAISSIETALDEKNYEPIKKIIEPIVSIENVAVLLEKTGKNITESIIWATEKATQKCKTGVSNSS